MAILRNVIARFSKRDRLAAQVYADCVAVARDPSHFRDGQVPDSVDGRFDLLALHLFIVIHRLRGAGAAGEALTQSLIDCFVRDMDQNLREMGAGDIGVARRVKYMAQALNGLLHGYEAALREGGDALAGCVLRNVFSVTPGGEGGDPASPAQQAAARRLASYVQAQVIYLSFMADADCLAGRCPMQPADVAYGETASED